MENNIFDLNFKPFNYSEWKGYNHPKIDELQKLLQNTLDTNCLRFLQYEREMLLEDQREFYGKIIRKTVAPKMLNGQSLDFNNLESEQDSEYLKQIESLKNMRIKLRNFHLSDSQQELNIFKKLRDEYFDVFVPKYRNNFDLRG